MSDAAHMRHLPPLMQDIIAADRRLDVVRHATVVPIQAAGAIREMRAERDRMTAGAHQVYGHAPARGDRGPSSAGAMVA